MNSSPKTLLSFIFCFHNKAETVESSLVPVLSLQNIPLEIIIINDGSNDNTDEVVNSLLDYYNHEQAFYFPYEKHRGMGVCLQEALFQVSSPYFIICDQALDLQEEALKKAIQQLEKSTAYYGISGDDIPESREVIQKMIESGKAPSSCYFIFSRKNIPAEKLFINPFLMQGHACELALRLPKKSQSAALPTYIETTESQNTVRLKPDERNVILFHAGMVTLPEKITKSDLPQDKLSEDDIIKTLRRIRYLKEEGQYVEALELTNLIIATDEDHVEAEEIKIFLLERLNRYVEASELKFIRKRKKMQIPESDAPLKREDILVSRPVEDEVKVKGAEGSKLKAEREEGAEGSKLNAEREEVKVKVEVEKDEAERVSEVREEDEPELEGHPKLEEFKTTVVIPVCGMALKYLEKCLLSMSLYCKPEETELIIVDNACFDDTFSFLDDLRERNFFNIRIIKNFRNAGFAQSVNQAIEKARGTFICVLHADTIMEQDVPGQLSTLLEQDETIGVIGPVTGNTMNPEQAKHPVEDVTSVSPATYLDSFTFCFRKDGAPKFDTSYNQAWYEDVDFCWQMKKQEKKIRIADGVSIRHYFGGFTDAMGLGYDSLTHQENLRYFNEKWKLSAPQVDPTITDDVEMLIQLGYISNIYNPFDEVIQKALELLTPEIRTTILGGNFSQDELTGLIRIMMVTDQRDVLRQLEERLKDPIDEVLRSELIHFYFAKTIFSRCQKYLDKTTGTESLTNRIYRLKIAWSDKNLGLVKTLISELMQVTPAHPEVHKVAGDFYRLQGEKSKAEEMYTLADQLDPFRFPWPPPVKSESGRFEETE